MMQVRTFLMMMIVTVEIFPSTPPKSDQGSDREQAPKRPRNVADERVAPGPGDPNDPDDPDGGGFGRSKSTEHPRMGGKPFVSAREQGL